jgi:hypothetical protein
LNNVFQTVIAAEDAERRDLFLGAATRLGTAVQNVEKDFWVCWTLDALLNGLPTAGPRLLFKGGTSLSKAFGLISRFSEDIDITVFRDDLGQRVEAAELDTLSGKKRHARLDDIRNACQAYIAGPLTAEFSELAAATIPGARFRIEADPDDKDGQTLLFWYPNVTSAPCDYIRAAVKIETGAKSALDPHVAATVTPYVAGDLPELNLVVGNVTTKARAHVLGQDHPARFAPGARPPQRIAARRPAGIASLLRCASVAAGRVCTPLASRE